MGTVRRNSTVSSLARDSGATYNIFVRPAITSAFTFLIALFVSEEFRKWAISSRSLLFLIASTWFFISAISGDIMMAVPGSMSAGSW